MPNLQQTLIGYQSRGHQGLLWALYDRSEMHVWVLHDRSEMHGLTVDVSDRYWHENSVNEGDTISCQRGPDWAHRPCV